MACSAPGRDAGKQFGGQLVTQEQPVIRAVDLHKKYGSVEAVSGVSLEVQPGEIVGLLGENGAGKTTTLEIIEGVREPTSGRALLFGEPSTQRSSAVRARLGVQLQATAVLPNLTVGEVLRLQASFYP